MVGKQLLAYCRQEHINKENLFAGTAGCNLGWYTNLFTKVHFGFLEPIRGCEEIFWVFEKEEGEEVVALTEFVFENGSLRGTKIVLSSLFLICLL